MEDVVVGTAYCIQHSRCKALWPMVGMLLNRTLAMIAVVKKDADCGDEDVVQRRTRLNQNE